MSLLMDALKRAEASKQEAARAAAGHEVPPAAGADITLEPLAVSGAGGTSLPELAAHIEALDADLATTPAATPATGTAGAAGTRHPGARRRQAGRSTQCLRRQAAGAAVAAPDVAGAGHPRCRDGRHRGLRFLSDAIAGQRFADAARRRARHDRPAPAPARRPAAGPAIEPAGGASQFGPDFAVDRSSPACCRIATGPFLPRRIRRHATR